MSLYAFRDYKEYVRNYAETAGRGQYQKIASHLRMHPTTVSQVFNGEKHLNLEQASELADYLGLNPKEAAYFLALVLNSRAGTKNLEKKLQRLLLSLSKDGELPTPSVDTDRDLDLATQAKFYSNWYYSGIRVLSSIPGFRTLDAISARLGIDRDLVTKVVQFLRENRLCELDSKGEIQPGPQATYLPPNSDFIDSHRRNWRMKAMERFPQLGAKDLAFSSALSLSNKDADLFRKRLNTLVEELYVIAKKSPPEVMMVFNVDWIRI